MRTLKKSILYIVSIIMLSLLIPINVHAAEKNITVELESEYKACTFKLTFETPGEYTASIVSPDGTTYECQRIDDCTMTVAVDKVGIGTWSAHISNDNLSEIGKVSLSIVKAKDTSTDVVDNIKDGKDITGLKTYFKNNTFNVSWTDESCGNVNIAITDIETSELIANETVGDEKSFSCELPSSTNRIMLKIVPSTSASIDGAALTYTYDVVKSLNTEISFESDNFINTNIITAHITAQDAYSYIAYDNDVLVLDTDEYSAGEYDIDIPLEEDGTHNVSLYAVDSDGNMFSTDTTIEKDTIAPEITLSQEYDGITVNEDTLNISGKVEGASIVKINDNSISLSTDNSFEYTASLHEGENSLVLYAVDAAGNETQYTITANYIVPTKTSTPFLLPIAIILVVAALLIALKKKKANANTEGDNINTTNEQQVISNDKSFAKEGSERKIEAKPNTIEKKNYKQDKAKKKETTMKKKSDAANRMQSVLNAQKKVRKKNVKKEFLHNCAIVGISVIAAYIVFNVFISLNVTPTESMVPTFIPKDIAVANRLAYCKKTPERGDIISFYNEENDSYYTKRVIGIAGDEITFVDGYVYINGEKYEEPYIDDSIETNCTKSFSVPENCVFVLGDNRENSNDSRYWNEPYISIDDITSKIMFIIPTHALFS